MDHDHYQSSSESELAIERQLNAVVGTTLFDEQPPYLNSFFRFQLGSNTFDGMLHRRTPCQPLVRFISLSFLCVPPADTHVRATICRSGIFSGFACSAQGSCPGQQSLSQPYQAV